MDAPQPPPAPAQHRVYIGALSRQWRLPVKRAVLTWNAARPNSFAIVRDPKLADVQVRSSGRYPHNKLFMGLALPRHGGHWSVRLGDDPALDRLSRRQLACHELGHTLGLKHVESSSCMNTDALSHLPGSFK